MGPGAAGLSKVRAPWVISTKGTIVGEFSQADLVSRLRTLLNAPRGEISQRIQSLWSGYGAIFRFDLGAGATGPAGAPVIVKCVAPPTVRHHPRGFSGDVGHERKLASYRVESEWYRTYARRTTSACRVPEALHVIEEDDTWLFVLEDLDGAGFPARRSGAQRAELGACLGWLAEFHARFFAEPGDGLWEVGTYWHLSTRPDELQSMHDRKLRDHAGAIDERLNRARHQTLVHGDAKLANFCFSERRGPDPRVAAVDFQYVGRGVGVKDVAYFLSSCLDEGQLERKADELLDEYFHALRTALGVHAPNVDSALLEREWRGLYPFAWADFMRFLVGWAPDHYKIHGYSKRMTELALRELGA